jgi:hypothetical protein
VVRQSDSQAAKRLFLGLLILASFIAGCSRSRGEAGDVTGSPTATDATPTATASPEPTPTATPTPEPTPIPAHVAIADQALGEDGILVADEVSLPAPGWLVIYRVVDGEPDEVIGHQSLAAGVHEAVEVAVDTAAATEDLVAGVHRDAGAAGVFDFPGEDEPFPGEPEAEFVVELALPQPLLEAVDQPIGEDSQVTLAKVELVEPGWVLIHADEDGEIGPAIGGLRLDSGVHENVALTIDWRQATPTLYAVAHEDAGESSILDFPDGGRPVLVRGEPVVVAFEATYPPDVLVYDQPVIDGEISIERAISDGPGWVAIYNEVDGQPGFIIGTAPLEDGLNQAVSISLLEAALTPQLFARLHHDSEPGDAFNFPGPDQPVLYNNRMPRAAAFRTDAGAHAFVRDQRLEDGRVSVAAIVSPVPAWAAIYADDDGQPGDLLGRTLLPTGISRDVVVQLSPAPEPGTLHLALYRDLGQAGEFEPPADDPPLTNDDGRAIRIPFTLLPLAE